MTRLFQWLGWRWFCFWYMYCPKHGIKKDIECFGFDFHTSCRQCNAERWTRYEIKRKNWLSKYGPRETE